MAWEFVFGHLDIPLLGEFVFTAPLSLLTVFLFPNRFDDAGRIGVPAYIWVLLLTGVAVTWNGWRLSRPGSLKLENRMLHLTLLLAAWSP